MGVISFGWIGQDEGTKKHPKQSYSSALLRVFEKRNISTTINRHSKSGSF
jgi:hypothetical protein